MFRLCPFVLISNPETGGQPRQQWVKGRWSTLVRLGRMLTALIYRLYPRSFRQFRQRRNCREYSLQMLLEAYPHTGQHWSPVSLVN